MKTHGCMHGEGGNSSQTGSLAAMKWPYSNILHANYQWISG
jgi:hypothetical protein